MVFGAIARVLFSGCCVFWVIDRVVAMVFWIIARAVAMIFYCRCLLGCCWMVAIVVAMVL